MRRDQKCISAARCLFALWMLLVLAMVASAAIPGQEGQESLQTTWLLGAVTVLLTLVIAGLIIPNVIYQLNKDKPPDQ